MESYNKASVVIWTPPLGPVKTAIGREYNVWFQMLYEN